MSQTSYELNQAPAMAGMMSGSMFDNSVESYAAEVAIGFGLGVVAGTDGEKQVRLPSDAAGIFKGVAVHQHKPQDLAGVARYEATETVPVQKKGMVWVPIDTVVSDAAVVPAADAAVFLVFSAAEGGVAGEFRADTGLIAASANAATAVQLSGARFKGATKTGGLALVEFNLPA